MANGITRVPIIYQHTFSSILALQIKITPHEKDITFFGIHSSCFIVCTKWKSDGQSFLAQQNPENWDVHLIGIDATQEAIANAGPVFQALMLNPDYPHLKLEIAKANGLDLAALKGIRRDHNTFFNKCLLSI